MPRNAGMKLALCLSVAVGLLLVGCAGAPATPTATPAVQASATLPASTSTTTATAMATATASAAPSSTPANTDTLMPTASATLSPTASATVAPPTATASDTAVPTHLPTRAPVTITPLGPPETAPVMSTTGGPAGYASRIQCQRAGAACAPLMPAGDVSFSLSLASDPGTPWTHFIYYGLSVEKDGVNVASQFMFVDAGWLQPGAVVGFGASRGFSQPGVYVIRSSGCLTTDLKSSACSWATIGGDVVTFRVQ